MAQPSLAMCLAIWRKPQRRTLVQLVPMFDTMSQRNEKQERKAAINMFMFFRAFYSCQYFKLVGFLYGIVQVLRHILNFERYMFSSCTKASSSNTVKSKALRIPRNTRSPCVFSNSLAATGIVLKWGGLTYCKPLLIVGFSLKCVRSSSLLCLKGLHFLQVWIQLPDRRNFCSSQEV